MLLEINFVPYRKKSNRIHAFLAQPQVGNALLASGVLASIFTVSLSAASYFRLFDEKRSPVENAVAVPASLSVPPLQKLIAPPQFTAISQEVEPPQKHVNGTTTTESSTTSDSPAFDRDAILSDHLNRIDPAFQVPDDLQKRVGFWFDVYTKYNSNRRVIHHSRFPWVIYKVVDVTDIINAPKPKFRWMRNQKADDAVKAELKKINVALRRLASGSKKPLSDLEKDVANALSKLGDVRKQARLAIGRTRIQTGQRDFFQEGLEVSSRYLGRMETIFRERNLPVELTRLPFVESSFNKHATSKVGASGIWQFMGNTGRKFMIVNGSIDERRSPFKATEAAARLLKENHLILYRQWPMAVTAWNHGPAGIRRASQAAGSRNMATIIKKYSSKTFNFASSNFYCEFLAALHAERYNQEIFGDIPRESALELNVVRMPRKIRLSEIIRISGLTKEEFIALNPDVRKASHLPRGFRVHVPSRLSGKVERLLASRDQRIPPRSS